MRLSYFLRTGLCLGLLLWLSGAGLQVWAAAPLVFDPPPVDLDHESSRETDARGDDSPAPDSADTPQYQPITPDADDESPAPQPQRPRPDMNTQESARPDAAGAGAEKVIRLFGMVEFRAPLKNVPKWERVYRLEKSTPSFGDKIRERMPKDVADRWLILKADLEGKPLMDQAKAVNKFFNQWPYKTDRMNWGVEDYWETPAEFARKSGDCEDYAITKYYAMRDLGVPADTLRIVALRDSIRGIGHAVLVVFMNNDAYVLDNLSNLILSHSKLTHYMPAYSVNEEYRWAHVKPLRKK